MTQRWRLRPDGGAAAPGPITADSTAMAATDAQTGLDYAKAPPAGRG